MTKRVYLEIASSCYSLRLHHPGMSLFEVRSLSWSARRLAERRLSLLGRLDLVGEWYEVQENVGSDCLNWVRDGVNAH